MEEAGLQDESPQIPEYKRVQVLAFDAKLYKTTEGDNLLIGDRLKMVEDAISGMDEQFERMWHGLSSFSRSQQQVIKTLELGVSAGESWMDTMRGMIGSRPDGLNHAISAPTVWGTVALVFDELEGQMTDVATNAAGLSEEPFVELVNGIIARAKLDLASVEDIQSLK
jgi:hypothetical protein